MKWFMNKFTINRRTIGNSEPAYFIADIAANHDGSLERAQELIYMAALKNHTSRSGRSRSFKYIKTPVCLSTGRMN
jgi:hypothetical protein